MLTVVLLTVCCSAVLFFALPAAAADCPSAREHTHVLKDFTFHTGETLPVLKVHYRTLGDPAGIPALVLHGTAGSGASLLTPAFGGELFGAGQILDARRYFLILPDALGTGKTTKPSDGLRGSFPLYNYDDMVLAQYRLLTEGLGIRHLRVIVGNSMGGMHAWSWAVTHPDFMDAIVPLASLPTAMSGRNWMMRRMITDAVRNDPAWKNGDYTEQPQHFRMVNVYYAVATNGAALQYQTKAPTREEAHALLAAMLADQTKMDANDFLYQWDASRDYDPSLNLGKIKAEVLAVNAADDERYPPECGQMEQALQRLSKATYHLIPASSASRGHATTLNAALWKTQLANFMETLPAGAYHLDSI